MYSVINIIAIKYAYFLDDFIIILLFNEIFIKFKSETVLKKGCWYKSTIQFII